MYLIPFLTVVHFGISFSFRWARLGGLQCLGSFILQLALTALDLLQLISHRCFLDLVAVPFCHGSEISFAFWQAQSLQKAILTAVSFRSFIFCSWLGLLCDGSIIIVNLHDCYFCCLHWRCVGGVCPYFIWLCHPK